MMYWNRLARNVLMTEATWTETYDVLKLISNKHLRLKKRLEPKHMMYWNNVKEKIQVWDYAWTETYDVLKSYILKTVVQVLLEPKHMMYWNQKSWM